MGLFDLSWFIFPFNQSKDVVFLTPEFQMGTHTGLMQLDDLPTIYLTSVNGLV